MRHRDQPTIEVTRLVACDVATAWSYVTDITLPARCSPELRAVEWLDGADAVAVGARFCGHNHNEAFGDWQTVCEVAEVEDRSRWVWRIVGPQGDAAVWGFEIEPAADGTLIRQWARVGPGPSGLTAAIAAQPDKEARIIARRLNQWRDNMAANLDWIASQVENGHR